MELRQSEFERVLHAAGASAGGQRLKVAILLPCYNEAAVIGTVIERFKDALPEATIYV